MIADLGGKTYLTVMNAQTKISAKGQVVIPKAVRDRLDWSPGTELEIEESVDGLLLRPKRVPRRRLTWDEFRARRPEHEGPPIAVQDMDADLARGVAQQWEQEERERRSK